jgi:hypothetical protein
MRASEAIQLVVALAAWAASSNALSKAVRVAVPGSIVAVSRSMPDAVAMKTPGEIVRQIDDPHTGAHWFLMREPGHPGGPGRMVLATVPQGQSMKTRDAGARSRAESKAGQTESAATRNPPVIRTGDRVIVEERTDVVESRLEAVALTPAAFGASCRVRMAIGGRMVRAVATGPGRASFLAEEAGQ